MRKSETSNSIDGPSYKAPRFRPNWFAAVICFILGTYLLMALITYSPTQPTFLSTGGPHERNPVGWIGANAVWGLLSTMGATAWGIPIVLFWMSIVSVRNARHLAAARVIAIVVAIGSLSGLWAMLENIKKSAYFPEGPGGWIGAQIYEKLMGQAFGPLGTGLLLGTVYFFSLLFIFTKDIGVEVEKIISGISAWRAERRLLSGQRAAERKKQKENQNRQFAAAAKVAALPSPIGIGPTGKKLFVPRAGEEPLGKGGTIPSLPLTSANTSAPMPASALQEPRSLSGRGSRSPISTATNPPMKSLGGATSKVELNIVKPEEPKKAAKISLPQSNDENYQFPPLSLLKDQVEPAAGNSEEEHRQNAENLLRILGEFGVEVTLGEIHVGPVITRYEVVPAAGVRVEKIAGLDKNIALGMRAQSVRILAPIPGKAAVGVEVPNQHPTPVGMRELLEAEDWASAKAEIPIALGKDVSGVPLISDLAKMPHLLIAGATGSGKSVCINSIVASILYSKSPKDLRMIMVDPKVVELKIFNSLPHMLIPVVTEPKKVPAALKWLLGEMEQRYQIFAKVNVRNIVGFNSRKKDGKAGFPPPPDPQGALTGVDPLAADDGIEIPERLPYIVAIIDELADLMMVAPAEIETSIARLAQLARAAGIHLIIATQRPSVNVITGVIKANLPSRIAFQVASQVDSRTILDTKGADTLIGRGDMLFSPPGTSRLVRAQGAFVSDEEVQGMVEFLKVNGPPQYAQSVQQQIDRAAREEEDGEGADGEDDDLGDDEELYSQALDVLKSTKRASTSMLQRRLRIGYNRAARIMEIMEDKGIVGPENGSSPREILTDLDAL
ncbi:MAG: DNA translocase FtsK [Opitutaceae bacterium]